MTTFPPASPPDWQDRHEGMLGRDLATARAIHEYGLSQMPGWAQVALDLRNRLAGRFGLKTEGADGARLMASLPVLEETPDRYCVGLQDKHLTFTLLTERTSARTAVTTSIWFNHWTGRAYLGLVLVPHKLILRHTIRSLA
ncbi:DUF2867 domain-containing protein [Aliishimia ponticola]|uniref:DUF2867 domain-containing protein n=1 Tax=Aliishimia ponticola TaxID=2499833 RepID=A0A4S4NBE7_9RHOB|nr:DUF2867 domain-containing protein [Aliishimia ponticola]THH36649.1 DUF2867 domain-containing protein [Aliishimia ponticola]